MERLLGFASITRKEADDRVAELHKKYPDYKFERRDHDARHEFVVLNVTPNTGQPLIDRMTRTAKGMDPVVEEADVNDPKTTTGVTTGVAGAPPAGGSPTTGA